IGNFPERGLDGLLIIEERFLLLRLRQMHGRANSPCIEDRQRGGGGYAPATGWTREEIRQRAALPTQKACERNLREVLRPGRADQGIGRDQLLLSFADIRPPVEQR